MWDIFSELAQMEKPKEFFFWHFVEDDKINIFAQKRVRNFYALKANVEFV